MFVFAPVLLAALVGVPLGWRKYRREMLLSAAVLAAHLVGYAALTPEGWHGGLCWGPRYLVPAVPLLCVPLAMVVAWVEDHPRTLWSLLFLLLCVLSIGVQLVGITVPGLTYAEDLNRLEPGGGAWKLAVYDPYYSQPLYSLRLLRLADMDYAWVHTDGAAVQIDWLFLAAAAAVLVAQAVLLARSLQRRLSRSAIGGLFLAGLCLALLLLVRRYEDPRFPGGDDRRAMLEDLRRQAAAGDVLVVTTGRVFPDYADFYLNYNKAALDSYVLKGTESELDPRVEALFARLIGRHERLWLATDKASGLGLWHPEEDWLLARLYPLQETAYSQYFRLFLFSTRDLPDPDRPAVQLDYTFGGAITLVGYDLPDRALHAGDALRLSLLWEARQAPPLDLTVFVQLLDPDGRLVVQADQYPVRGQRPTSSWQPGERIRDPYALLLPGDIPAGSYQLIVGLYELETMTRWSVANAAGLTLGDYVDLGSIEIE